MGKISTFINGLLCVALIGGFAYGGFNVYSNISKIPNSDDTTFTIGESSINGDVSMMYYLETFKWITLLTYTLET